MPSAKDLLAAPHPLLAAPSTPVTTFDTELADLVQSMHTAMRELRGVGLAAVQIGVPLRVFVVAAAGFVGTFVNPERVASTGRYRPEEGCLSVPGVWQRPYRPRAVELRWQDTTGAAHTGWFDGFPAHVIAHELDHLDGVLLDDPDTGRW
jgi:peptide deformylase